MWEEIPEQQKEGVQNLSYQSHRLKIPGGWIVRTIASGYESDVGVAQTFVSDPIYTWKL